MNPAPNSAQEAGFSAVVRLMTFGGLFSTLKSGCSACATPVHPIPTIARMIADALKAIAEPTNRLGVDLNILDIPSIMNNPEFQSKLRDKEIADNEATRTIFSDIRVSTWALIAFGIAILVVTFVYLAR
jgi:hypothetical protein